MDVRKSDKYVKWYNKLTDRKAKLLIASALLDLDGNTNKIKTVFGKLKEYKIDYGPGYRIYFYIDNGYIYVVLAGGDKTSQDKDIRKLKKELKSL